MILPNVNLVLWCLGNKQEEVKRRRQSLEMPPREKYGNKHMLSDQEEKKRIYHARMKAYRSLPKKQTFTPKIPKNTGSIDYLREIRMRRINAEEEDRELIPRSKHF